MNTPPDQTHTAADTIIPRYLNRKNLIRVGKGKVGDVVVVCWDDAQAVAEGWELHGGDGYGVCGTVSVGFLWEVEDTHFTLVSTLNGSHHTGGITIPVGCVTAMFTLGEVWL